MAEAMNELVKGGAQFSSYQNIDELTSPIYDASLEAWETSQLGAGHDFSSLTGRTNPAGPSLPTTDPAGTYSGPGASAPTPAAAGTYIPVTGATSTAAEIVDHVGSYSLAGADAPTLAQASQLVGSQWEGGYYVPRARASSETPDSPGYYTPLAGMSYEEADPAGTYTPSESHLLMPSTSSSEGASEATLAQPGYYVPLPGSSFETKDDPGYYTPYAGMSSELTSLLNPAPAVETYTSDFELTHRMEHHRWLEWISRSRTWFYVRT